MKQNLLNKKYQNYKIINFRTAVEVKTKDLQQTLIRLEKISEATTKLAKSRDEQAFIIAEKDKITTETIE